MLGATLHRSLRSILALGHRAFPATRYTAVVLALAGVGFSLRLVQADYSFDGDEIFSVALASGSFGSMLSAALADTPHPVLHNLLLWMWINVFGPSELSVRGMSALISLAFLIVMSQVLPLVMNRGTALAILLLLAVSPYFVFYGQQARAYTLICLLSAINLFYFLRLLKQPHQRDLMLGWAGSAAALMLTQYMALLPLLVGLAILIGNCRDQALRYTFLFGAACLPAGLWLALATAPRLLQGREVLSQISWITPPKLSDLPFYFSAPVGLPDGFQLRYLLLIYLILAVAYSISAFRRRSLPKHELLLILVAFAVPVAVLVISIAGSKSFFVDRQLAYSLIALVVLYGIAAEAMPALPRWTVLGLLAVIAVLSLPTSFPQNSRPPFREVAAAIDRTVGSEPVVVYELWVEFLGYYRRQGPLRRYETLSEDERRRPMYVVCRPFDCKRAEQATANGRGRILHHVRRSPDDPYFTLTLYRLD